MPKFELVIEEAKHPKPKFKQISGKLIEARFDYSQYATAIGKYGLKAVASWSGCPVPVPGETWLCRVLTEWDTGMLVVPERKLN